MFRSVIAAAVLASAASTPAMRGLANVATTVTICNAIPTADKLSVDITDATDAVISVSNIGFRQCNTSSTMMVDDTIAGVDYLGYAVKREGNIISSGTSNVAISSVADQNVVIIAPSSTAEGTNAYSPRLESLMQSSTNGFIAVSASYCVGLTTNSRYTVTILGREVDNEELNYAESSLLSTSSYSNEGMPQEYTADYTYIPGAGTTYNGKISGGQQLGKAAFITCTGIEGNTGDYAPAVSVFGTAPAGTGAAAGLAAGIAGWVTLAVAAVLANKRL